MSRNTEDFFSLFRSLTPSICKIHGYAFSLVAVTWFDHDRAANFTCRPPRILGAGYRSPCRHWNSRGI